MILLILVFSSGGGGGGDSSPATKARTTHGKKSRTAKRGTTSSSQSVPGVGVYVVKPGDTLGGIAASTGVAIDELIALNPGIDPRTLVTGQRLKLRQ